MAPGCHPSPRFLFVRETSIDRKRGGREEGKKGGKKEEKRKREKEEKKSSRERKKKRGPHQ